MSSSSDDQTQQAKPPLKAHVVMEVSEELAKLLTESKGDYRFENIRSEEPVLIVGGKRFVGYYRDCVGTDLVFDPKEQHMAGYVGNGVRRLVFGGNVD